MDFSNMIISRETINDIIIALGSCNDNLRKKHAMWSFDTNGEQHFIFPKDIINDTDKIITYLRNLLGGKTLMNVHNMIYYSDIEYNVRSPIMAHLSQLISNAKMSQEIVEIKNSIKDLNDKFAILMDVLELNKSK